MALSIIMGKPGAGKSTLLTRMACKAMKKGRKVYSNVFIEGALNYDIKDLGQYQIDDALVIIDEAGFAFNSRNFKSFTSELYRFFTIHRHFALDIVLAVQFWDRLDIVIRELTQTIIVVQPTIFKYFLCKYKEISVKIDCNKEGQIQELYKWKPISTVYFYKRQYFKYFDSFYLDALEHKDFELYKTDKVAKINKRGRLVYQVKKLAVIDLVPIFKDKLLLFYKKLNTDIKLKKDKKEEL